MEQNISVVISCSFIITTKTYRQKPKLAVLKMLFTWRLWVCDRYSVRENISSCQITSPSPVRSVWIGVRSDLSSTTLVCLPVCVCVVNIFGSVGLVSGVSLSAGGLVISSWQFIAFCHHESSFCKSRRSSFTSVNNFIVLIPPRRSLQFNLFSHCPDKGMRCDSGLSCGVYSFAREPQRSRIAYSLVPLCFHGNHVRPRAGQKETGPFSSSFCVAVITLQLWWRLSVQDK